MDGQAGKLQRDISVTEADFHVSERQQKSTHQTPSREMQRHIFRVILMQRWEGGGVEMLFFIESANY